MLKEQSMQIKYLKEQGVPPSKIAKQLGVCRQTVYNHLNRRSPYPKERALRVSKLSDFKAYIRQRLEHFDLPATVLYEELKARGYGGKLTILRDFMAPLKAAHVLRVTERFETRPGQQAQLDWGECGFIDCAGERKKLYVFVLVLGYSRMMYARFTTSCRLPELLTCQKEAFSLLGVPREILVDNMKQAVESHDTSTGTVRWNVQFLDFAEHCGFLPIACPPYWPRVKGKVERGVGYIKASFLEGRAFTDLDDLNAQLWLWLDQVANRRVHGTTLQRPVDRHALELAHLRPFASVPFYDTRAVEMRRVPSDCHIAFKGVRYSVDPLAVGQTVVVKAEKDAVGQPFSVYFNDTLVARHIRRASGSSCVSLPEHALSIKRLCRGALSNGRRKQGRKGRFEQIDAFSIWTGSVVFPEVQVRSLNAYEALLLQEGA
jgi:transposase